MSKWLTILIGLGMMLGVMACKEREDEGVVEKMNGVEQIYDVNRVNEKQPDGESEKVGVEGRALEPSGGNHPGG